MLLYQHLVMQHFNELRDLARSFQRAFSTVEDCDELLSQLRTVEASFDRLQAVLPDEVKWASDFGRHLNWTTRYLKQHSKLGASNDPDSMAGPDIDRWEAAFRDWVVSSPRLDSRLREAVSSLLERQEFDSAVRKAFVILKVRMVEVSGMGAEMDGRELVNRLFGAKGQFSGRIDESQREGIRDLLAGLYGVFRNKVAHDDWKPELYESDAVLSSVNWALIELDKLRATGA